MPGHALTAEMTTKAWLEGHPFDLQDLAELLAEGDVRVIRDTAEDAYYLTSSEIDNPPEPDRFHIPAELLIVRVNGLGRANNSGFLPVKLSGRYTDATGKHIHTGAGSVRYGFRVRAKGVAPGSERLPSPWPARLALSNDSELVARVLVILGRREELDWYDLYKVHEIIRRDIKPKKIDKLGRTTKTRDRAFTASADRYDVSGDLARHAVDKDAEPAKKTMTLDEGRAYISGLVTRWLDSLI